MRFLLADDHDLVRETIAAYLRAETNGHVDTARDLTGALDLLGDSGQYDLILLDYRMPGMDGLLGLRLVIAASRGRPVAILSGAASPEIAQEALRAGAAGFLPKTMSPSAMLVAARTMTEGNTYTPEEFLAELADESPIHLTPREMEMLRALGDGKSNKQIAYELSITEPTVKLHIKTLSRKLGARNRTQAAMIGRDKKYI